MLNLLNHKKYNPNQMVTIKKSTCTASKIENMICECPPYSYICQSPEHKWL